VRHQQQLRPGGLRIVGNGNKSEFPHQNHIQFIHLEAMTMRMNRIVGLALTMAAVTALACAASGAMAATKTSPAEAAIQAAAKQNRYAIVTFYRQNDAASASMRAAAKKLQAKYAGSADFVIADVDNKVHQSVISKYGVDRSPIPTTLVIAPNGAVTAEYAKAINKTDISDAFVSNGVADVLKVLQDGKLAAVCIQSSKTKFNKESLAVAEELKSGGQFRGALEIVRVDSSDTSEAYLVQYCKVDPGTENAQLVVIAPPWRIVGAFDGTSSLQLVTAILIQALSGGTCGAGGGCAPGACGP